MNVTGLNYTVPQRKEKVSKEQQELHRKQTESEFYFQCVRRLKPDAGKKHVLFEKTETKSGVMGNKTLAEAAGYSLDIDGSLGAGETGELTEEQIEELKEQYDVENMTAKEYRALLKDLVDMKILTTTEAKMQFARQIPPCSAMLVPSDGDPEERSRMYRGNYLMKSKKDKDYTEYLLDMIEKGTCQISPPESADAVRRFYEREMEYKKKIESILMQLQRDSSKTDAVGV